MKKCELLAPCGSLESLYAAISNGATSVYFGGSSFNARMYAQNFSNTDIEEAINYAHKRKVKVFITLNILIKDSEIEDVKKYIENLYLLGIDGIIVQDYGILNLIIDNYPDLIVSCSTQTTIDDLEGALYFEKLGAKRIVLARECSLDTIKKIKENTSIEIEVFAHGALCVSYSGQCLLSSYIGRRSGNRGKCAQPCRKKYKLYNTTSEKYLELNNEYLLSLKDLMTINNLPKILETNIDSIKLEGRMKNPEYVANITRSYRLAMDDYYENRKSNSNFLMQNLSKTFHRNFTSGYIFKDDIKNMNASKNNVGYLIGKVTNSNYKGYVEITLINPLFQNDIIRFDLENEITSKLVKVYDSNLKLTNQCSKKAYLKIKEHIPLNTYVFKTFDYPFDNELKSSYPKDNYKLPINIQIIAKIGKELEMNLKFLNYEVNYKSSIVNQAINSPIKKEKIIEQINKLSNTPYYLEKIDLIMDENIFINIKDLNELRRNALSELEKLILNNNRNPITLKDLDSIKTEEEKLNLTFKVHNYEQYDYLKSLGYNNIYFDHNSSSKVDNNYNLTSDTILIKNYGALNFYQGKELIVDYSLNVFNYLSCYYLFKNGVKRITPSLELTTQEFIDLSNNYFNKFSIRPNLEFVAYTSPELMISKFCPLKCQNQCGVCHQNEYLLQDDFDSFHLYTDNKCYLHLLSTKKLNKIKDLNKVKKYASMIRLEFFKESKEEIKKIIDEVNHQLFL